MAPDNQDERVPHASWQPSAPPRTRRDARGQRAQPSPQPKTRSQLRAEERARERDGATPIDTVVPDDQPERDDHAGRRPRSRRFTVVLTLLALVLLGWAALCFVDTSQPLLVALTSIAPVLSVLALPVFAIAVAGRHVVPATVAIAAAVAPWALVSGSAVAGPGPTSGTNRQTLRVMTIDGASGAASAPTIVRATRSFGVDVLVITGLSGGLAHDLTIAGLSSLVTPRWFSDPTGQSDGGVGLWSHQPISDVQLVPDVSQPAAITQLTTTGGPISLVVAHAGGPSIVPGRDWRSDLSALAAASPNGPRIMAGDLGGTPWHPAFRALRSAGWHEAADVLGRGLRPTWPAWGPVPISPLDQVMVGGGVGITRADTVTIPGTSHRALMVTAVLPNAGDSADASSRPPGD